MDPIILASACSAIASVFTTIASAWVSARWQRTLLRELTNTLTKASDGQISGPN